MHPSPAQEWLQNYCLRTTGAIPNQPVEQYLLQRPTDLTQQPANPVQRPDGAQFGVWFDSLETPTGQLLGSQLGIHSGYFQEFLNWAPSVSFQFDLTVRLAQLLGHPGTHDAVRNVLFPFVFGYAQLLEQQLSFLRIHTVHGQHIGTALDGTWKALLTQVRLQANRSRYQPELITETLQRIDKELLTQRLKESTKSEAKRQHGNPSQTRQGRPRRNDNKPKEPQPNSQPPRPTDRN